LKKALTAAQMLNKTIGKVKSSVIEQTVPVAINTITHEKNK